MGFHDCYTGLRLGLIRGERLTFEAGCASEAPLRQCSRGLVLCVQSAWLNVVYLLAGGNNGEGKGWFCLFCFVFKS